MELNLNTLSLKELRELQNQVAKAISTYEDRRKKEVLAELEEMARERGFTWAELTSGPPPRRRAPGAAKYANPANPADTWSGRGRKPNWFIAALAAGKSPEDMAI